MERRMVRLRRCVVSSRPDGHRSVRQRSPLRGHAFGAALRQGKDGKGRIRSAFSRKDTWSRNPKIRNLVTLAVAIDDRILSARPHNGAAQQMAGRDRSTGGPRLFRTTRLGDLKPLFEIGIPKRYRVLVEAVGQPS